MCAIDYDFFKNYLYYYYSNIHITITFFYLFYNPPAKAGGN